MSTFDVEDDECVVCGLTPHLANAECPGNGLLGALDTALHPNAVQWLAADRRRELRVQHLGNGHWPWEVTAVHENTNSVNVRGPTLPVASFRALPRAAQRGKLGT